MWQGCRLTPPRRKRTVSGWKHTNISIAVLSSGFKLQTLKTSNNGAAQPGIADTQAWVAIILMSLPTKTAKLDQCVGDLGFADDTTQTEQLKQPGGTLANLTGPGHRVVCHARTRQHSDKKSCFGRGQQ